MNAIGNALKGIAKVALPIVGTALGGPLGGLAGGALGGLVSGGGVKGAVTGAALGGLGGGVLGKLPVVGSALGRLGGAASGGGLGGLLGQVGGFVKNNPALVLGGVTTALGAQQQAKAGRYQQQALDLARSQYAGAQPLRDAALGALGQATQPPDLSWMTGGGNPYSAPRPGASPLPG